MAKVIVYKCDFCDYIADATVTNGQPAPRMLRPIGWMEACDDCVKKAQNYLEHLREDKDDQGL